MLRAFTWWIITPFILIVSVVRPCDATIIISPFSSSQSVTVSGAPPGPRSAFSEVVAPQSIGGSRDIFLMRTSTNRGTVVADSNDSLEGVFAYSAGLGTSGFASLQFDGFGGAGASSAVNPTGLGSVSLIEPNTTNNRFQFAATSDLGGDVIVRLFSGAGNVSTGTLFVLADPTFTFLSYTLPFSAFTVTSGTGANFASIGAIEVEVGRRLGTPVAGLDLAFDIITVEGDLVPVAVPEPSTLLMAGTAIVMGIGHTWRRRRLALDGV